MKLLAQLVISVVLLFTFSGCQSHLHESVKAETESHDVNTVNTDSDVATDQETTTSNDTTTVEKKTQDPTVTDTETTIKVDPTPTKAGKTIVIKKHHVVGQKADVKVTSNDVDTATKTQQKVDENVAINSTHDTKTKVEAEKVKDSKPSIPLGLSCLSGGVILLLILTGMMIFCPQLLMGVIGKVVAFIKGFWAKFKEE